MTEAVEDNGAGDLQHGSRCSSEELETPKNVETDRVATATDIAGGTPVPNKVEPVSVNDEAVEAPEDLETSENGGIDRVATATDIGGTPVSSKVEHVGVEASEDPETPKDGETDRVTTASDVASSAPVRSNVGHESDKDAVKNSQTASDEVSTNEEGTTHDGELLRGWRTDESVSSPIDYSQLDENETPYEHGFLPGDHIIRWDMVGAD